MKIGFQLYGTLAYTAFAEVEGALQRFRMDVPLDAMVRGSERIGVPGYLSAGEYSIVRTDVQQDEGLLAHVRVADGAGRALGELAHAGHTLLAVLFGTSGREREGRLAYRWLTSNVCEAIGIDVQLHHNAGGLTVYGTAAAREISNTRCAYYLLFCNGNGALPVNYYPVRRWGDVLGKVQEIQKSLDEAKAQGHSRRRGRKSPVTRNREEKMRRAWGWHGD